MNKTTLFGKVGSVKLNKAKRKTQVLNIKLAVELKVDGQEITEWVLVKVWGERAEKLLPHVQKDTFLIAVGQAEVIGLEKSDGTVAVELILHVTDENLIKIKDPQNRAESHEVLDF